MRAPQPGIIRIRVPSSAFASRDVSCVTCRACDVARDRSIGRESGEGSVSGGRGDLAKIPPPSSPASSAAVPLPFT